jgi:hypothetical protein
MSSPHDQKKSQASNADREKTIESVLKFLLSKEGQTTLNRPNDPNHMGPTQTKLVNDLMALAPSKARDVLLRRAKNGEYGDFSDTSGVCPQLDLIADLTAGGYTAMIEKVQEGEYDGD